MRLQTPCTSIGLARSKKYASVAARTCIRSPSDMSLSLRTGVKNARQKSFPSSIDSAFSDKRKINQL